MGKVDSTLAWRRGVEAAISLIDDAYDIGLDEMQISDENRDGRSQVNLLLRAIDSIQASGERQMLEGFCCVLNDLIGEACEGGLGGDYQEIRDQAARPVAMTSVMPEEQEA